MAKWRCLKMALVSALLGAAVLVSLSLTETVRQHSSATIVTGLSAEGRRRRYGNDTPSFRAANRGTFSLDVTQDMLQRGQVSLPPLLPNFKNPCWVEDLPPAFTYKDTWYNKFDKYACAENKNLKHYFRQLERWLSAAGTSKRLRCFPYFFVLGVAKSGTTDLFVALMQLQDMYRPGLKEPSYWNRVRTGAPYKTKNCNRTSVPKVEFAEYLDLFDGAAMRLSYQPSLTGYHSGVVGDFSPSALSDLSGWSSMAGNEGRVSPWYTTAHHLHSLRPGAKFIVILREPADRTYSLYRFRYNDQHQVNVSAKDFHIRVTKAVSQMKDCFRKNGLRPCIYPKETLFNEGSLIVSGLYWAFLNHWLEVFPLSSFLIIRFEDYMTARSAHVEKIIKFLNMEPMTANVRHRIDSIHARQVGHKTEAMLPETGHLLRDFFRPYNVRLAALTGDSRYLWQDKDG